MKKSPPALDRRRWLSLGFGLSMVGFLVSCSPTNLPGGPMSLNSRYTDEQPAVSGNGRFLAFVSNRNGNRNLSLYDLQQRQFIELPGLNRLDAIAEEPSISNTARYIVYLTTFQGRLVVALYDRLISQSQIIYEGYQGWVRHPSISPDGRYIVFENAARGQWDIEVIDRGPNIELDSIDGTPPGSSLTPP